MPGRAADPSARRGPSSATAPRIRIGGVEVALIAHRDQAFGRELFTNVGIDPAEKRILGVKSANHFRDAFGPLAEEVLYADGNGHVPLDCRKHEFTKATRPLWPLDPGRRGILSYEA